MYIVIKMDGTGTLKPGTPPKSYDDQVEAQNEAERLAGQDQSGSAFLVFKALSRSAPARAPIETTQI